MWWSVKKVDCSPPRKSSWKDGNENRRESSREGQQRKRCKQTCQVRREDRLAIHPTPSALSESPIWTSSRDTLRPRLCLSKPAGAHQPQEDEESNVLMCSAPSLYSLPKLRLRIEVRVTRRSSRHGFRDKFAYAAKVIRKV